ncbi:MAG: ATP-binding protein [Candidatus Gastranaerophilaceae bacterium]
MSVVLLIALMTPFILQNVVIAVFDAFAILGLILGSIFLLRMLRTIEIQTLQKKIDVQLSQLKVIFDNMPLVAYLKDTDGKIVAANTALSIFLGIKLKDIIGKNTYDLYKDLCFDNLEDIKNEDKNIIKTKKSISVERLIGIENSEKVWYRISKTPVLNDNGEVIRLLVIFKNISDEKEIDAQKEAFIATMIHDLKTPTIAQINALNLLLNNTFGEIHEEQSEIIEQIKSSCEYLKSLIFSILDTYMYTNGQVQLCFDEFNMSELLENTTNEISNLLLEKRLEIVVSNKLKSQLIVADKLQLKRVIINLLSNAILYGQIDSSINIDIQNYDKDKIKFLVKNKADYIPDEKLKDIFNQFNRVNKDNKYNKIGNGLGLFLTKKIINAHNGDVIAQSNKEEGSCTFGFIIPLKQEILIED